MLWAGQHTVLEVNKLNEGVPDQHSDHPDHCDMVSIFTVASEDVMAGRHACVDLDFDGRKIPCLKDPDGNWIGFLEDSNASVLADTRLEQTAGLKEPLLALNRIILRSSDPKSQADFFQDIFGTRDRQKSSEVYIGSTSFVHCLEGAPERFRPEDREYVQRTFIPRVYRFKDFVAHAESMDATLVNDVDLKGGFLRYYLDPQGQLFGFQERLPFDPDNKLTHNFEDQVARDAFEVS